MAVAHIARVFVHVFRYNILLITVGTVIYKYSYVKGRRALDTSTNNEEVVIISIL